MLDYFDCTNETIKDLEACDIAILDMAMQDIINETNVGGLSAFNAIKQINNILTAAEKIGHKVNSGLKRTAIRYMQGDITAVEAMYLITDIYYYKD